MKVEILKGATVIQFKDLVITLSRPLRQKMYFELLTPDQNKKKEIEKRSGVQNKAIHMVCNDLFKNVGEMSAQDYYFDFKRNYLAFEIKKDNAEYAGIIADFEALELVMLPEKWRRQADKIYTHRDANVKQFHHAFDSFCIVHSSRGDQFRHPSDFIAMLQDEYYKELIK